MRYENGLPHAFINTVMYLDYDRQRFSLSGGAVSCELLRSSVIAKRGSTAHLTGEADPNPVDPPGPNPRRCFDIGGAVARALGRQPVAGSADRVVILVACVPDAEEPLPLPRQRRATGRGSTSSPRASSPAGAS